MVMACWFIAFLFGSRETHGIVSAVCVVVIFTIVLDIKFPSPWILGRHDAGDRYDAQHDQGLPKPSLHLPEVKEK